MYGSVEKNCSRILGALLGHIEERQPTTFVRINEAKFERLDVATGSATQRSEVRRNADDDKTLMINPFGIGVSFF